MMVISSLIFGLTGLEIALTSTIYIAWFVVAMNTLVYGVSHAISDGFLKRLFSDDLIEDLMEAPRKTQFKFIGKESMSWLTLLICATTSISLYQYGAFMTASALGVVSLTVFFAQAYSLIIALAEESDDKEDDE